jgi:Domain of unknown function (DUF4234)
MAQLVPIPGAGTQAKIRAPVAVPLLAIITLGIYVIFWWYFINREMADLGRAKRIPELGDNPILSVLAITIGAFVIIPPLVSLWRTCKRIKTAQNRVMGENNFSPILSFVLGVFPILHFIAWFLMQGNLNQVWRQGAAVAPPAAAAPAA